MLFLRLATVAALVAVSLARPAYADDSAAADALFQDAKALMEAEKPREACPKFEASFKLEKKLGTLLNWSDCLEKTQKLAGAFAHFTEAAEWAAKDHDSRASYASDRRDALKPRLPKLLLDVKLGHERLAVALNGAPVTESAYGVAVAVDPGPVIVSIERGDAELEKRAASAKEGEVTTVSLDLDAIAKAHPDIRIVPASRKQRTAGLVVGGIGVAGLVVFAGLEGGAYAKKTDASGPGLCKPDPTTHDAVCTPKGFALERAAGNLAEAGQWVAIGSGVVAAVGITLLATAPRDSARAPAKAALLRVVPVVPLGRGPWGLAIGGEL